MLDTFKLDRVCCGGLPLSFNRFVGLFQKRSFIRMISAIGDISGKRILDIGCGSGRWASLMARMEARVTGLDISEDMIRYAKSRFEDIDFIKGSISEINFEDKLFDIATSITVIQHIPCEEQARAVFNISRCLKNGGYLIAMEEIKNIFFGKSGRKIRITFPNTPSAWDALFERNGFEIIKKERILHVPLLDYFYNPLKHLLASQMEKKETLAPKDAAFSMAKKIDYFTHLIMTPFSYMLEFLYEDILNARSWTEQCFSGTHQTFLLRKKEL
jgi:ubiquinone/menaquinone biosynthesis C-methylase UbiE